MNFPLFIQLLPYYIRSTLKIDIKYYSDHIQLLNSAGCRNDPVTSNKKN